MVCTDLLSSSGRVACHSNPRENPESIQKEKANASRQQQQQQQGKAAQPKRLSKQLPKQPVTKNSKTPSQQQQQQGSSGKGDSLVQSKKSSKSFPGSRPPTDTGDTQPRSPVDKRRRDRPLATHGGSSAAEGSSASLDRNAKLHLPTTAANRSSAARSDSPLQKSPINASAVNKMPPAGQSSGSAGRGSPVVAYANGEEGSWSSQEPPTVSDDWGSGNDAESIDDAISKCSTDDDKIS